MSVPYDKLRVSHPLKKHVEHLNVLLKLFIFWFHAVVCGGMLLPNARSSATAGKK